MVRTIRLIRNEEDPSGKKVVVLFDNVKSGELKAGEEITLEGDDKLHIITLRGGMLSPKTFMQSLLIPEGTHSYIFQIDMLDIGKNGYTPVLRPTDGRRLPADDRLHTLIGTNALQVLLDPKTRSMLKTDPKGTLKLNIEEENWSMTLTTNMFKRKVLTQQYASFKESMFSVIRGGGSRGTFLRKEDQRRTVLKHILDNYFSYLPDYVVEKDGTLRLKP